MPLDSSSPQRQNFNDKELESPRTDRSESQSSNGSYEPVKLFSDSSKPTTTGQPRGHAPPAAAKRSSVCSVKEHYEEKDDDLASIKRQQTRDTVCSALSAKPSVYDDPAQVPTDAVDTVPMDGQEYEDIDPDLVTWSEKDTENPRNWPKNHKAVTAALVSIFTFVPPLTSSILAPAVPAIMADFHNSNETVGALMVSIMVLSWALCSLVVAPLSEVFGRRIVLLTSMAGCLVFNIACAVAPNTAAMLVFRALGGAINCAPLAVGAGTIADLYEDVDRTWPLALYGLGPSLGPVVAPVISGFVVQYLNWHWTFWIASIIVGVVLGFGVIFYRESYAPLILGRRAQRLRRETGNPDLHTIWEVRREPMVRKLRNAVVRPAFILCTNFVVFGLGLHMAFVYGFMYLMLVNFPDLWSKHYHYSLGITGLMYISLGAGMVAGTAFWTPVIRNHFLKCMKKGKGRPEDKLFFLPASTLMMAIGLFWYGWSAEVRLMWLMPNIGIFLFGAGIFVVFQAIQSYLVELNPRFASSILAAVVLGRGLLGAVFPLFGHALYNRLGYGFANTVIGILTLILGMPFPIIIYFKGEKIRAWCDAHITII